jgi:hypothetical protein
LVARRDLLVRLVLLHNQAQLKVTATALAPQRFLNVRTRHVPTTSLERDGAASVQSLRNKTNKKEKETAWL